MKMQNEHRVTDVVTIFIADISPPAYFVCRGLGNKSWVPHWYNYVTDQLFYCGVVYNLSDGVLYWIEDTKGLIHNGVIKGLEKFLSLTRQIMGLEELDWEQRSD
jgi:hypothetical protein